MRLGRSKSLTTGAKQISDGMRIEMLQGELSDMRQQLNALAKVLGFDAYPRKVSGYEWRKSRDSSDRAETASESLG